MPKVVGMSGADRLNILNFRNIFEWHWFNLHWRLGCSFNTNVCAHMCASILLCGYASIYLHILCMLHMHALNYITHHTHACIPLHMILTLAHLIMAGTITVARSDSNWSRAPSLDNSCIKSPIHS